MTYRTAVRPGEGLAAAIARAGAAANQCGEMAYEIVCGKCGYPIGDHERAEDCAIFIAAAGKLEFDP